jgi:small-conductance mechanosensitive channel
MSDVFKNITNISIGDSFQKFKNDATEMVPKLIISIIMIILVFTVADWIRNIINGRRVLNNNFFDSNSIFGEFEQQRKKKIIYYQLGEIIYYLIIIFGITFSITNLGFQTPAVLTILGTFIVTIGISMQGLIGNIWAGIYISIIQLYDIGDKISISTVTGTVINYTLFNTVIFDEKTNSEITIPNTTIQNGLLINFSRTH